MIRRISKWLSLVSSGKIALIGLVVFLSFTALVLPAQSRRALASSNEAGSPDQSFLYSAQDLYQMAEAYGEQGRLDYIRARFSFDLIWPVVYAFFLTTSISWVFTRAFHENSPWQLANLAPLAGLAFDYLENIAASLVMLRYPAQTAIIAEMTPIFTLVKWIFVGTSFVLLLVGIARLVVSRLLSKGTSSTRI